MGESDGGDFKGVEARVDVASMRLLVCTLALAAVAGTGLAQALPNVNPANRLANVPIDDYRYDHAQRCTRSPRRGTIALQGWLARHARGQSWGIMRCERLSGDSYSLHAEGRAIDWHLDARREKDRRAAKKLIRTLLASDRNGQPAALARRMGVQGLNFDCKSWWSGQDGLGKYSYCYGRNGEKRDNLDPTAAHVDHVHIELNRPGARKRTSFWQSPLGD